MTASDAELHVRYVTWGEYGAGVYESQVIRLVELLAKRVDAQLWALVRRGNIKHLDPPACGRLLSGPVATRWPWGTFRLESAELSDQVRTVPGRLVLHCRGPLATIAALHARRGRAECKVIHDYRGLDAAEVEEERGPSRWTRRLASLEATACREADVVSVVSAPLAELVIGTYGVATERVVVHPTGVETSRFAWGPDARKTARAELGVGGEPLAVYVGSAAHWQLADLCVRAGAVLATSVRAKLLVLTLSGAPFTGLAEEAGLPEESLLVRSATHDDIARLLCAADLALLPRRVSPVNAVAAPVKFAEYLAAGVPVVTVDGAGPFANQVEHEQLGVSVSSADAAAVAEGAQLLLGQDENAVRELRARCRAAAVAGFDLDGIADRYVEVYRTLFGEASA